MEIVFTKKSSCLLLGGVVGGLTLLCILTDVYPVHDAIEWHGIFRYYYYWISHGVVPFWNPYTQAGTPFYFYFQALGLLEPSNLIFAFLGRLAGGAWLQADFAHYMFIFLVFILGSYLLMAEVSGSLSGALIFTVVLLLSSLPTLFRQDGAFRPYMFVSWILYSSLMVFRIYSLRRKIIAILLTGYLFALQCNDYVPVYGMVIVAIFLAGQFIFGAIPVRELRIMVTSRRVMAWTLATVIMSSLVVMPMLCLHKEIQSNELVPTVRMLQNNGDNLPRIFASDLEGGILDTSAIAERVTVKVPNFLGMFLEPLQHILFKNISRISSEVFIFVGFLPLFCAVIGVFSPNRQARVFLLLTLTIGLLMSDFANTRIYDYLPLLNKIKTSQSFVTAFLLSLCTLGSIGWAYAPKIRKWPWILVAASTLTVLRTGLTLFVTFKNLHVSSGGWMALAFVLVGLSVVWFFFFAGRKALRAMALGVLFLDLGFFCAFHFTHFFRDGLTETRKVASTKFPSAIADGEARCGGQRGFSYYRVPFSVPFPPDFNSFFGHELICWEKSAFPNVYGARRFGLNLPVWDHFFMTRYYYDYLVNVSSPRQAIPSALTAPILAYYPQRYAIGMKSKYDLVDEVNSVPMEKLSQYLYYEAGQSPQRKVPGAEESHLAPFFDQSLFLRQDPMDTHELKEALRTLSPTPHAFSHNVKRFDANTLTVDVDVPEAGFIYYADGFDRHWRAYVDGKPRDIAKSFINFKSVVVPEGRHLVTFSYEPALMLLGVRCYWAGSLLFLVLLGGSVLLWWRGGVHSSPSG